MTTRAHSEGGAKTPAYLKCAHPGCSADFDYLQGRLFRLPQFPRQDPAPANSHGVTHFWLCTRCKESFTIDYEKGLGVLLRQRSGTALTGGEPSQLILRDERDVTPIPSRLQTRRRRKPISRDRKITGAIASVQISAVEMLESRNIERRG